MEFDFSKRESWKQDQEGGEKVDRSLQPGDVETEELIKEALKQIWGKQPLSKEV